MRKIFAALTSHTFWYKVYAHRIYVYGFIGFVGIGIYVGFLLVGENSLDVLLKNITQRDELIDEVNEMQPRNALLQKDLFELRGLEP